ncbi:MAG: hypothetical protein HY231_09400 [Acidobacteria bacterium]|nr:hypothetical protein [Acidobacteriota bacterium]
MKISRVALALVLLLFIFSFPAALQAQKENDTATAEALLREAIKVRGGETYLQVRSIIGRGTFTAFEKGQSGLPAPFVDYIVYPDHERTEFGKGGNKLIQTNVGHSGWIYTAAQKMIHDQKEEQIKSFQQGLRQDVDFLLRKGWQETGTKLLYLGRREVWKNTFSEAIRVVYSDGLSVTLYLDPRAKLPLMIEYSARYTNEDGDEKLGDYQVRYYRWVSFGGVQFPTIQDSYRDGKQTARVNYDSVNFNVEVPEKLFTKPNNIKDVK